MLTVPPRAALPQPQRQRWQPLRSGLLNLYRYDHEEFWYTDGRLLLRGNNGSGKSRVLALQLPFLLDGETVPQRLEPDGDPAKRLEWNLLMNRYEERTGYTWLELGRCDAAGIHHFLTLGCGLSAARGKPGVKKWFFITKQRIGQDLFLQGKGREVKSKQRLIQELQGQGRLFETARDYRHAIDHQLFKLGEGRYEALINLLIQLRRPQLSRHLDERALSDALSAALPPFPEPVLKDVSDAYKGLDKERQELETLQQAAVNTDRFLEHYKRYAQTAVRRRANTLKNAHNAYEDKQRLLREAKSTFEQLEAHYQALEQHLEQSERQFRANQAQWEELRNSPEMRSVAELEGARQFAETRLENLLRAQKDYQDRATAHRIAQKELQTDQSATNDCTEKLEQAFRRSDEAADEARLSAAHGTHLNMLLPWNPADGKDLSTPLPTPKLRDSTQKSLESVITAREKALKEAARTNAQLEDAQRSLEHELTTLAKRDSELQQALEDQKHKSQMLETTRDRLADAYAQWHSTLKALEPLEPVALQTELELWTESGTGPLPIQTTVLQSHKAVIVRLAGNRATLVEQQNQVKAAHASLKAKYDEQLSGHHLPPPMPHTRDVQARATKPGAPLWQLVDFAPELTDQARAGIEAGLEASGLLDAWVTPEGHLLDAMKNDVILHPAWSLERGTATGDHTSTLLPSQSLATWLRPSLDAEDARLSALRPELIEHLLQSIGAGPSTAFAWVSCEGEWKLGPLQGTWHKPGAQHIGQSARDAARRQQLEEYQRQMHALEGDLQTLDDSVQAVARQEYEVQKEVEGAPNETPLQSLRVECAVALRQVEGRRKEYLEQEKKGSLARAGVTDKRLKRDTLARDMGLLEPEFNSPASRSDQSPSIENFANTLNTLVAALSEYRAASSRIWTRLAALENARSTLDRSIQRAETTLEQEGAQRGTVNTLQKQEVEARARYETLEASQGASVREIQARLKAVEIEVQALETQVKQAQKDLIEAAGARGKAGEAIRAAQERFEAVEQDREKAIGQLKTLVQLSFFPEAGVETPEEPPEDWSTTRSVELARALDIRLTALSLEDKQWTQLTNKVNDAFQELTNALQADRMEPSVHHQDGLFIVSAHFGGRPLGMALFRGALSEEITVRELTLTQREREVLENHLLGEVHAKLHELLTQAGRLVNTMSHEMRKRSTATGMSLEFNWREKKTEFPGLTEALQLFRTTGSMLSPSAREQLGVFFQQCIQAARDILPDAGWQEILTQALDYRAWFMFIVVRQHQGRKEDLTKRSHGTGSGGEKAIALTIPQCAAAATHYASADPHAPRFILLDEAFAGIDNDMRSQCMGLLQSFDLDFVMTSEREWGCYATVSGVGISQLTVHPGIDAVGVTRWSWNGRERVPLNTPLPPAIDPEARGTEPEARGTEPEARGTALGEQTTLFSPSHGAKID